VSPPSRVTRPGSQKWPPGSGARAGTATRDRHPPDRPLGQAAEVKPVAMLAGAGDGRVASLRIAEVVEHPTVLVESQDVGVPDRAGAEPGRQASE